MLASARLHRLDPESYLRGLFRVLAHWPRDRYLELAPRYWAETRSRLVPTELARELGPLTVPPPPQEQPTSDRSVQRPSGAKGSSSGPHITTRLRPARLAA
ncbi:MAG: transposase domain-containing protein [Sorangiineae bacterium]|nr:transposase domain-containing protein [Polyangiaceae bacterium]MEB2322356.1 transposase domain-containing protein [Sorangiineae bacterium]